MPPSIKALAGCFVSLGVALFFGWGTAVIVAALWTAGLAVALIGSRLRSRRTR
ncbi:MAG TPA: hypothetical protein VMB72_14095 [Acidimicrobiales bacterium]|nr:hypothetical protein [Acidimicrobiales bacterium]